MLGGIVILLTILFEYRIGWIGVERPESEVPFFIFESWRHLRVIWGWQLLGFFTQTLAFALLLKNSKKLLKSLLWAILFLCGLLIVIAFGITLGSYQPTLQVYDSQPELFAAFRGAVRALYSNGGVGLFSFLAIAYLLELFGSSGVMNKRMGLIGLSLIVLGVMISFVPGLPGKLIGAVVFFIPVLLGYAYWRPTKTLNNV